MIQLTDDKGFSLLEMVVAILILSLSFAALYPAMARVPGRVFLLERRAESLHLAKSKLEEIISYGNWDIVRREGNENQLHWEAVVEEFANDDIATNDRGRFVVLNVRVVPMEDTNTELTSLQRLIWVSD
ncbi:type II secretion system protein [Kordiimonas sp. SCSIO 12603]|uniref:type IV pilus modification PilV family protein n=1 Tax=Kordiimonas sp. SCSIO 12603 TaxID=2829596 RepID=UPI002104CC11|nr:type II secretion system protein [Kordiimonas sp. SCSIO 12603]UTW58736.1 type II secretion system protein [Kordiimonas sp. SCSIO 12603]